jgi:Fumarylacetoacetate (FAA) hydrolase family
MGLGKSCDTFCPTAPSLTTADAVPDPHALAIKTPVNGKTVQNSITSNLIFRVPTRLAFISRASHLNPETLSQRASQTGWGSLVSPGFPQSRRCGGSRHRRSWHTQKSHRLSARLVDPATSARSIRRCPGPQRRGRNGLPTVRLAGKLPGGALHIFFKHRGKIGRIAEAATLCHFSHVEPRIE